MSIAILDVGSGEELDLCCCFGEGVGAVESSISGALISDVLARRDAWGVDSPLIGEANISCPITLWRSVFSVFDPRISFCGRMGIFGAAVVYTDGLCLR